MLLFKKIVHCILRCYAFVLFVFPIYFLYGFLHVVLSPFVFVMALYNWSEDSDSNRSFVDYYKRTMP